MTPTATDHALDRLVNAAYQAGLDTGRPEAQPAQWALEGRLPDDYPTCYPRIPGCTVEEAVEVWADILGLDTVPASVTAALDEYQAAVR
jgi:hypothetical protein